MLQQRPRRQRRMVGAALIQPHLHGVQLVLHRGAVPRPLLLLAVPLLLLLLLLRLVVVVLLLLLLLLRRGRGRPVVEAGRGDGA